MQSQLNKYPPLLLVFFLPMLLLGGRTYVPFTLSAEQQPWNWKRLDFLEGKGVTCVAEGSEGVFWFGGIGKIYRFDGWELIDFPLESQAPVEALNVLEDGSLVIVQARKVLRFRGEEWTVLVDKLNYRSDTPAIIELGRGVLIVQSSNRLLQVNVDTGKVEQLIRTGPREFLSSATLGRDGVLWLAKTMSGLERNLLRIPTDPVRGAAGQSNWRSFHIKTRERLGRHSLVAADDGKIWYSENVTNGPVIYFDAEAGAWKTPKLSEYSRGFDRAVVDSQGSVWMSNTSELLKVSDQGDVSLLNFTELGMLKLGLKPFPLESGRLFLIGGSENYLLDLNESRWEMHKSLRYAGETPDGIQWFYQTNRFVVTFDPDTGVWRSYRPDEVSIGSVRRIFVSPKGNVFVFGSSGGFELSMFDGERWHPFKLPVKFERIPFTAFAEADDGGLWIGLGQQIGRASINSSGKVISTEVHFPSTGTAIVNEIIPDTDGTLWIEGRELLKYDPIARVSESLRIDSDAEVEAVLKHSSGDLWLSEGFSGIFRMQGNTWESVSQDSLISGDVVVDLIELNDGSILAASDRGMRRFDGETWTRPLFSETLSFLPRKGTIAQTSEGDIWANLDAIEVALLSNQTGMESGKWVARYSPDRNPPKVWMNPHFDEVESHGNTLISWNGRDFMGDTPAGNLQYSWRINGQDWSPFSYETSQRLTDLSSGDYTFEVRARDADFNLSQASAVTQFAVGLPVWRRAWFILTILSTVSAFVAFFVILIFRQRDRALYHQRTDEMKTAFFMNVSHELRTPITVILGPLRSLLADETDAGKRKSLEMMERNVHRVSTLVSQLLDFRKIEENGMVIEAAPGDLVISTHEILGAIQPMAESKSVEYKLELPSEPFPAKFDGDKLNKILSNLVSNAIKYTAHGGQVRVRMTSEILSPNHALVTYSIEDTGRGIPEKDLEQVFEQFYRVPESSIVDGSGIGLSLTKELTDLWGGEIQVESPIYDDDEAPGSRFTVSLPIELTTLSEVSPAVDTLSEDIEAATEALSEKNTPAAEVSGNDQVSVLVVEDDSDIRQFISDGLKGTYQVEVAVDGAEGLAKARASLPDLIVSDVMMPEVDGVEMCRLIKNDPDTAHIPVIMLTSKAALESQLLGLQTGAEDYITKPFHMVLLETRISNILESRRRMRERFLKEYMVAEQSISVESADDQFVKRVIEVLESNFHDSEFGVEALASGVNMSLRNFQRKLKSVTGETPARLLANTRVKKAGEWLERSDQRIGEIAFKVGYLDLNLFGRHFKSHFGMTPTAYREQVQGETTGRA